MNSIKLFVGNSNPELGHAIAKVLSVPVGNVILDRFSDSEINVQIKENIRGCDVFVVQSTCAPTNDNLMELLLMVDALKRASAQRIFAVIPYFGYARQDRRVRSARVPISARVVADMLSNSGVSHVLTVDLHAEQIQGFFNIPVDNVYGAPVLIEDIKKQNYDKPLVVSPDIGGVVRARAVAKALGIELAIVDKRRSAANTSEAINVIGDVKGRSCIIVDDIIDTAGTLANAANILKEKGAAKVYAYATHAVLSGHAIDNLQQSQIDQIIVTDSIPLSPAAKQCTKIRQESLGVVMGEALRRVIKSESVSAMFS